MRENGILLRFAESVDRLAATNAKNYFAQQWNYRYSAGYGSEEFSVRSPDKRGHDPLEIRSAHLLADGRSVFVEIPQIQPSSQIHLRCELPALTARDYYLTAHWLGSAFKEFSGYQPLAKKTLPEHGEHHHGATVGAATLPPRPVKWTEGKPGRALVIEAASGLQFAQKELRAKAGERLTLTLQNPDVMPHNWVLVKPGSVERVGDLANKLITEPDAVARHYVPDSADILCHTPILDPQKEIAIHFDAPSQPGRYPYLCTFPGHWMLMRGELVVD
jgi:azurin